MASRKRPAGRLRRRRNCPTQAKSGLEWATGLVSSSGDLKPFEFYPVAANLG
jgi:hypothetical protein